MALALGFFPQFANAADPPRPDYAELRVRIVDSEVLEDASVAAKATKWKLSAKLEATKAVGALEKRAWASFTAKIGVLLPFIAKKTVSPEVLFSPAALVNARAASDDLLGAAIVTSDSPKLQVGSLNFALPGTSRSLPNAPTVNKPSTARVYGIGSGAVDAFAFGGDNPEVTKLKDAVDALKRLQVGTLGDAGFPNSNDSRLAYPLSAVPFGPTPAAYSVSVRVTCENLPKYLALLENRGAELKFSGCDAELPRVSLMTVEFDPPQSATTLTAIEPAALPQNLKSPVASEPAIALTGLSGDSPPTTQSVMEPQSVGPAELTSREGLEAYPTPAFLARVREVLKSKQTSKATPLLVIVDDGFPSQEAYSQTKKFFDEADQFLRTTYVLPPAWFTALPPDPYQLGVDAELQTLPEKTSGPRGLPGCESLDAKSCRMHSKGIEKSLQAFTQLVDGPQPVRVIWIPVLFAQPGAAGLAYRVHRFAKAVPDAYLNERLPFSPTNLTEIQKEFFYMLSRKGVGYPQTQADWAISRPYFGNILNYLRAYSAQSETPVFINLSWRTDAGQTSSLAGRGNSRVMLVVAAGNPCTPDKKCEVPTVDDASIDRYNFLKYATFDDLSSFVVANVTGDGLAVCNTARLDARDGTLAFPGGISDDCGTSFSAPRLAWLLAANERYSTAQARDANDWALGLRIRLAGGRDPKACAFPHNMVCLVPTPEKIFPGLAALKR